MDEDPKEFVLTVCRPMGAYVCEQLHQLLFGLGFRRVRVDVVDDFCFVRPDFGESYDGKLPEPVRRYMRKVSYRLRKALCCKNVRSKLEGTDLTCAVLYTDLLPSSWE